MHRDPVPATSRRRVLVVAAAVAAVLAPTGVTTSGAVFTAAGTVASGDFPAAVLGAPTNLVVSADSTLTWHPTPSAYADGYKVYRAATEAGPWTQVGVVTGQQSTTWTDPEPAPDASYYQVRAFRVNWLSAATTAVP